MSREPAAATSSASEIIPYTKSKLNGALVGNELFVCGIKETKDGFSGSETSIRSRKCLSKSHGWLFDKQNKNIPFT